MFRNSIQSSGIDIEADKFVRKLEDEIKDASIEIDNEKREALINEIGRINQIISGKTQKVNEILSIDEELKLKYRIVALLEKAHKWHFDKAFGHFHKRYDNLFRRLWNEGIRDLESMVLIMFSKEDYDEAVLNLK